MTARKNETPEERRARLDRKNVAQAKRRAGKPRQRPSNELREARRALNQHMYYHHRGGTVDGTIEDRLSQHDELHIQARRLGMKLSHSHEELGDDESLYEVAHRYLAEGNEQHGAADTTEDAGRSSTVDSGARVRRR